MHAMKAPIATGNEQQISEIAERAIQCLSKRSDDEIAPIERINQKLRDLGIDYDIRKVLRSNLGLKEAAKQVEKSIVKNEIGKVLKTTIEATEAPRELVEKIREFIHAGYQAKTKLQELYDEIVELAKSRNIDEKSLSLLIKGAMKEMGYTKEQVYYRMGGRRNLHELQYKNDKENPIEDSEDHRSEVQITSEVNRSLYVNRPEDPEVEQVLEEQRPVKDQMYIERLEKESNHRLEELNKKQEQIQVLNTRIEGYEDALTKFQSASDPTLQTNNNKPGKIWMYPFDWILEIQYAAAYKQGLEMEHDGTNVTKVTRITGLERR